MDLIYDHWPVTSTSAMNQTRQCDTLRTLSAKGEQSEGWFCQFTLPPPKLSCSNEL